MLNYPMRTVVLIGTDHKFQMPVNGVHTAEIESIRSIIRKLCGLHKVNAIAEEMDLSALQKYEVTESVAQQLCAELDLVHQFSDPSLGACPSNAPLLAGQATRDVVPLPHG